MPKDIARIRDSALILGVGCLLSLWVFWTNSHSYAVGAIANFANSNLASALFTGMIAVLDPDLRLFDHARIGDVTSALIGTAATCVLWLGPGLPPIPLACAQLLVGICSSWFSLRLAAFLTSFELADALALSIAISAAFIAVNWLASFLNEAGNTIIGIAAPLLTGACLVRLGVRARGEGLAPHFADAAREVVLGPLLCIWGLFFVYASLNILLKVDFGSFAYGEGADAIISVASHVLAIAILGTIYYLVCVRKLSFDFYTVIKVPVILLTCALVVAGLTRSNPMLQMLTFPTVWLLGTIMRITLVDIARHGGQHGMRWIALGYCGYSLAYYVGRLAFYVASLHADSPTALNDPFCFVLLGVAVLVVVVTFRPQDRVAHLLFRDINNPGPSEGVEVDAYELKCEQFARACGLSGREAEIMAYVAKGYSKPFIAERLVISDNTVRTHVKRIYEKAGVHSRRELQERVDAQE